MIVQGKIKALDVFAFALLMAPAGLFHEFLVIPIQQPDIVPQKMWTAHISIYDAALLVLSICAMGKIARIGDDGWVPMVAVTILAAAWGVGLLVYNNISTMVYIDGIIYTARFLAAYIVGYAFIRGEAETRRFCLLFIYSGATLATISLVAYYFFGYTSGNWDVVREQGRLNTIGLGQNIAGSLFVMCLVTLWAYQVQKRPLFRGVWLKSILVLVFIWLVLLTGSRKALALAVFLAAFIYFHEARKNLNHVLRLQAFTASVFLVLLAMYVGAPLLAQSNPDFRLPVFSRIVDAIQTYYDSGIYEVDGRYLMYNASLSVIKEHPWGLGLSNWAIQEELQSIIIGTHTHNLLLQGFLLYGWAVLFTLFPLYYVFRGVSQRNVLSYVLLVFVIGNLVNYELYSAKYLILISIIMGSVAASVSLARPRLRNQMGFDGLR